MEIRHKLWYGLGNLPTKQQQAPTFHRFSEKGVKNGYNAIDIEMDKNRKFSE